nr:hypothetical protein [Microbulbifer sp. GX H0434]
MPRFVLPLAPEPRQAELPVERDSGLGTRDSGREVSAAGPGSKPEVSTSPVTRLADAGILDVATTESRVPSPESRNPVEPHKPAVSAAIQPKPVPVAPFVLSGWWLGGELLAVDSREPGAALPVESLLNNIARALNWHELPREQDRMRWPLAENRFGPAASADQARDTCTSWLEAASARRPVKSIWLMGRQAQDFCAPVAMTEAVHDWNGIRVIAMPSLSELLQQPERKRELWQLLRRTYPEQTRAR